MICASHSRAAKSAPATISSGARSQPIASTAIRGLLIVRQPKFCVLHTAVVVFDVGTRKSRLQLGTEALRVLFLLNASVIERDQAAGGRSHFRQSRPCGPIQRLAADQLAGIGGR